MNLKKASSEQTCCQCGMEKSHWSCRTGYKREGALFCCEPCADEIGCDCEEALRKAKPLKSTYSPALTPTMKVSRPPKSESRLATHR